MIELLIATIIQTHEMGQSLYCTKGWKEYEQVNKAEAYKCCDHSSMVVTGQAAQYCHSSSYSSGTGGMVGEGKHRLWSPACRVLVVVHLQLSSVTLSVTRQLHRHIVMLIRNIGSFKLQTSILYCTVPSASVINCCKLRFNVNLCKCQNGKFVFIHGFVGPIACAPPCCRVWGFGSYAIFRSYNNRPN